MSAWVTIILAVLQMIITWLENRPTPTDRQKKRLNHLIAKMHQMEDLAVKVGCKPGGEIDPNEDTHKDE